MSTELTTSTSYIWNVGNMSNFIFFQFPCAWCLLFWEIENNLHTFRNCSAFSYSYFLTYSSRYRVSNHRPGKSNSVFQWDRWMVLIFSIVLSTQYSMQFHMVHNKWIWYQLFVYNFLSMISLPNGLFLLLYLFLVKNYCDFSTWIFGLEVQLHTEVK